MLEHWFLRTLGTFLVGMLRSMELNSIHQFGKFRLDGFLLRIEKQHIVA
jgi:hypothetical protein